MTHPANFFVYYETDADESKHALALGEHGYQEVPGAWVTTSHFTPGGALSRMAFACISRPVVLVGESF